MTKDFKTFFDIYVRPSEDGRIDRDSYEFRYAAAALLVACSKADLDEDPEEQKVIIEILKETFSQRLPLRHSCKWLMRERRRKPQRHSRPGE